MRFPTAKFTEIAKTSILIILILNFFIIFFEIKYIEYIYLVIFLLLNFLLNIIIVENYKNNYLFGFVLRLIFTCEFSPS